MASKKATHTRWLAGAVPALFCAAAFGQGQVVGWGANEALQARPPQAVLVSFRALDCYEDSVIGLLADGSVRMWGSNYFGEANAPVYLGPVQAVAAGSSHMVVLRTDGSIACWGEELLCEARPTTGRYIRIAAGPTHSAAIRDDQTLVLWGDPEFCDECAIPSDLGLVREIAVGSGYSAAIRVNGSVRCWGDNESGQCSVPPGLGTAVRITTGDAVTIALRSNGSLRAWGDDDFQLVSRVPANTDFIRVSASSFVAAGLRSNGKVKVWGDFLGFEEYAVPADLKPVVEIATTSDGFLALQNDGTVRAWGFDYFGELQPPRSIRPVQQVAAGHQSSLAIQDDYTIARWGASVYADLALPADAGPFTRVACGYQHGLALRTDGVPVAWGTARDGLNTVPAAATSVVAIATGHSHSLALRDIGRVIAWGSSVDELGNTTNQSTVPADLVSATRIAAGFFFSAARRPNGELRLWGDNASGQCEPPAGLGAVSRVAAGRSHVAALGAEGQVICWGSNALGQLNIPPNLGPANELAAGRAHTLALLADGSVRAWGANNEGQCQVPAALSRVQSITAGFDHSLAVLESDASNCFNQAGNGIAVVTTNGGLWQEVGTWTWMFGGPQIPGVASRVNLGLAGSVGNRCPTEVAEFTARAGSTLLVPLDLADPRSMDHQITVLGPAIMAGRIWLLGSDAATLPPDLDVAVLATSDPRGYFDVIESSLPAPPGKFLTLIPVPGLGGATTYRLRLLDLQPSDGLLQGSASSALGAVVAAASGDLDSDGLDDLVLAIRFNATQAAIVQVLLSDGLGGFKPNSLTESLGASEPTSVAVGDADGDGRDDIVVGLAGNSTARLVRQGGPGEDALQLANEYPVGATPLSVLVIAGDTDAAGSAGMIAVGCSSGVEADDANFIALFAAASSTPGQQVPTPSQPRTLGRRGRIIATGGTSTANVGETLLGGSPGGLVLLLAPDAKGQYALLDVASVPGAPVQLDFADIDGDGFAEVITANQDLQFLAAGAVPPVLTLFRGSAEGIGEAIPLAPDGATEGLDVTLVDDDDDGDLDIVAVSAIGSSSQATLLRIGTPTAGASLTIVDETTLDAPSPILSTRGDIDGVGGEDLYLVLDASGGGSNPLFAPPLARPYRGRPSGRCTGDITGDGIVSGADMTRVLVAWATVGGGASDLTGDGIVDAADLSLLLLNWGPCGDA